jgi:hypothetical protein
MATLITVLAASSKAEWRSAGTALSCSKRRHRFQLQQAPIIKWANTLFAKTASQAPKMLVHARILHFRTHPSIIHLRTLPCTSYTWST